MKFGNGSPLLTLNEAKKLDEYAGVLDKGIILIDIDDERQSDILMDIVEELQLNCRVYKTTRGRHFYFKNTTVRKCGTGVRMACGLHADIKLGDKNSYAVLKFKGQERFIEWDMEDGNIDPLPPFLLPIKSDVDLLGMSDGDGRNETLYKYILTLQRSGLDKEAVKSTLGIINRHILADPLPESELETITRDEAFIDTDSPDSFFDTKGRFLFDVFAKYLVEKHHIIKIHNQLHIYQDGVYRIGYHDIQAEMIRHISNLSKTRRQEVMSYLELLIREDSQPAGAEFVAFKNGVYNVHTDEFIGFSPELVITNRIDHNFNPEAYSEIADRTLDKLACGNKNVRMLLEEVIGYNFYRRNELRKAFVLTGDKANGKSTFLNMITNVLGQDNTVSLDMKELGDRFKTAELFGKLANIGDDIGDEFIANPAIFKKVVSGDRINVERKGQNPFDFSPYAKQLFSANSIPRIKDKSGAVMDRLIIVPFDATFSKSDPDYDPFIKYKLQEEDVMEYLIQLGIKGLRRVLENQSFTMSEGVVQSLREYEENNNPILLFFKEIDESEIMEKPTRQGYQRYSEFCIANNLQQMSNIEFSKQVKRHFKCDIVVTSYNGKTARVFRKTR